MGRPRTAFQRAADQEKIAALYLEKRSINEIAQTIGRTRQTVYADIRAIESRWFAATDRLTFERKAEELARIDRIELLSWEGYYRSIKTHEQTKTVLEEGAQGTKRKAESRKEELIGDPRWLDRIAWCVEQRAKILGLYAPAKSEGRVDHTFSIQTEFDREFERLVGRLEERGKGPRPRAGETLPRGFGEPS